MPARKFAILIVVLMGAVASGGAAPGDVFAEYCWFNEAGDAGQALRVGGKWGQQEPDRGWAHGYVNAPVKLDYDFDLDGAVRAEVVIEKLLCHDGTRGLAIKVNEGDWLAVPEAPGVAYPQWEYQHQIYPAVAVPLSFLKSGKGNEFRMRVSPEHPWKWPQNLINGVHFRIFYDKDKKAHPTGEIEGVEQGGAIGEKAVLSVTASSPNGPITRVDYLGYYEGVNFEGDGIYRQWHGHFFHGKLTGHIGSSTEAPFTVVWDTSWTPDQREEMLICARVVDESGMIYMTPAIGGLRLVRDGVSVELCKPYNVPKQWVTRRGVKQERFDVTGDVARARAMQLAWSSWSPGYMTGISINGRQVFDNEGPKYKSYEHRVTLEDVSALKAGANVLATGASAADAHGMEVNWPGIMVLVRYEQSQKDKGQS